MRFKTMSCRDVDEEFAVHASVLGGNPNRSEIMLDDLPDGTNTFESVVDFCYGFNIDVTATTIALLYRTMDMYLELTSSYVNVTSKRRLKMIRKRWRTEHEDATQSVANV
ncbi:hypothetical protein V6N13_049411 [Hibiscus sabdariffa]